MSSTNLQHRAHRHDGDRPTTRQTVQGSNRRPARPTGIVRWIVPLALAAALLLPAAALARPRSRPAVTPSVWTQALTWLSDLLAGRLPVGDRGGHAGLTSASGDAGSTIDPDGARRTPPPDDDTPTTTARKPAAIGGSYGVTIPPG